MNGLPLYPDGRAAAVSLTYDDAVNEHLDHAMVDLEAAGLRGTFYIPTTNEVGWAPRLAEWREAARRGHELGNHTRHHPCPLGPAWVRPNFSLEAYSEGRMEQELLDASRDLAAVDGLSVRTYAYTCGADWVGPERRSYRPMVARLFPAARSIVDGVADPWTVDLSFVPSRVVRETHGWAGLVELVDRAIETGGWAVFTFHGVGGGHRANVTRDNHRRLCDYIADRSQVICCQPFLAVAQQVRSVTNRPWDARG